MFANPSPRMIFKVCKVCTNMLDICIHEYAALKMLKMKIKNDSNYLDLHPNSDSCLSIL